MSNYGPNGTTSAGLSSSLERPQVPSATIMSSSSPLIIPMSITSVQPNKGINKASSQKKRQGQNRAGQNLH